MKKCMILCVTVCLIFSLLLSSCSGYNRKMREHLGNADNYTSYRAKLTDIYCYDAESGEKITDFSNSCFRANDVVFELRFFDYETVRPFLGSSPDMDVPLEAYSFQFKVSKKNNELLFQNGFYDVVSKDTTINVVASDLIYMDTNFFYIAAVEYDGTIYLPFESGFENIVEMMNENKSIV